ncbi:MAG: hypothetical protein P4L50_24470 [Anaerolineaceae bacterium]|nr:hypothetical protein [Anaerolineaceae bacterium]
MNKKSYWQGFWIAIVDYWYAFGLFIGLLIAAYDDITRFTSLGLITSKWVLPAGVLLFLISGIIAIIKLRRKMRDLENENKELKKNLSEKSEEINIGPINFFYGIDDNMEDSAIDLKNYDEIVKLMDQAIEDTKWLANGFQLQGEPDFAEKRKIAFQSGKAFHEYFETHRHYFSAYAREHLEKLDKVLSNSIRYLVVGFVDGSQWIKIEQQFREESKTLQEEILNDFRKSFSK